jgi:DNA-binding NarL/FixJ family response regulator
VNTLRVHVFEEGRELSEALQADPRLEVLTSPVSRHMQLPPGSSVDLIVIETHNCPQGVLQGVDPQASGPILVKVPQNEIFNALVTGADNYIDPAGETPGFREAVWETLQGGATMSREIALQTLRHFDKFGPGAHQPGSLTYREEQVLDHLAKGFLLKEVAGALHCALMDVRMSVRGIYKKLHFCRKSS